jgi:acylphosphatase
LERRRVSIHGLVQGVFFRETVRQISLRHAVVGFVRNAARDRVEIEAEGEPAAVAAFIDEVLAHPPAAARVEGATVTALPPRGDATFVVASSVGR